MALFAIQFAAAGRASVSSAVEPEFRLGDRVNVYSEN